MTRKNAGAALAARNAWRIVSQMWLAAMLLSAVSQTCLAASFYVSATGSPTAAGTFSQPWDLQTALNHPSAVHPGDTIWLFGGVYRAPFTSYLKGAADTPSSTGHITVRNYRGQRVIIDAAGAQCNPPTATCSGYQQDCAPRSQPGWVPNNRVNALTVPTCSEHVWFWGLEFVDSSTNGLLGSCGTGPTHDGVSAIRSGIEISGPYVRVINSIVHDLDGGIVSWEPGVGDELYGNLVFNNGWMTPEHGYCGHGIRVQNKGTMRKRIRDNVTWNNFNQGFTAWGDKGGISYVSVERGISFNNGAPPQILNKTVVRHTAFQFGSGVPATNVRLIDSFAYTPADPAGFDAASWGLAAFIGCADSAGTSCLNQDLQISGNYLAGAGGDLTIANFNNVKVRSNVFVGGGQKQLLGTQWQQMVEVSPKPNSQSWVSNRYFDTSVTGPTFTTPAPFHLSPPDQRLAFPAWKAAMGESGSSYAHVTFAPCPAIPRRVTVLKNAYEPRRGHIVVYNWRGCNNVAGSPPAVSVDLSPLGLPTGTRFKIHDIQRFNTAVQPLQPDYFGPVVASGTYTGAAVAIPMPAPWSESATPPVGFPAGESIPSTRPEFAVYLVRGQ